MTTPDRPTAAGVFVVRDPDVCAALEQLLAPHRTEPAAPADTSSAKIAALMAAAEAAAAALGGDPTNTLPPDATIEQILDHVHTAGHVQGRALAVAERREEEAEAAESVRRAESSAAHAERQLDQANEQLRAALAKVAELESRPAAAAEAPRKPRGNSPRAQDRDAFTDLARRMDEQARTQPKPRADVLRIAAKYLRDEIEAVYGAAGKKAS